MSLIDLGRQLKFDNDDDKPNDKLLSDTMIYTIWNKIIPVIENEQ
jgi:hypothetical protein